jgi:L-ascorbate metabolism protein UlaG (beta-lactamase superfamily)
MLKMLFFALLILVALPILLITAMWLRMRRRFPKGTPENPKRLLRPRKWRDDEVTVGWVGHSTVMINLYGVRILTDPVLGPRVGVQVGPWQIGPKRHVAPALRLEDLDRIDLILLSHAHMDHFDLPTLRKLAGPRTRVITAGGTSKLLRHMPFGEVTELQGEESVTLSDLGMRVQAVPVRHWGNRFPWNTGYGYTGYLIEKNGVRLFFPGDTAYTPEFVKLRKRGKIDLAFMPIGAYSPDSFQRNHCTPEQAGKMFLDTGARWLMPIHYDTFVLSQEPVKEPLTRLLAAAGGEKHRIATRKQGDVFRFGRADEKSPRQGAGHDSPAHSIPEKPVPTEG